MICNTVCEQIRRAIWATFAMFGSPLEYTTSMGYNYNDIKIKTEIDCGNFTLFSRLEFCQQIEAFYYPCSHYRLN